MTSPTPGDTYRHSAGQGLAARARTADPDLSDELTAEMAELDLPADAVVTVTGIDDNRDLVLLSWTDGNGTPRITSVTLDDLDDNFTKES